MDMKNIKAEADKIKMPSEMKERIIANCRNEITEKNTAQNIGSGKRFRKPAVFALTAVLCASLAGITTFASSEGVFSSIRKAFYNDENALRAPEPSDYAFVPDVEPMTEDDVTVSVTEAVADSHGIRIFMDITFENGIPQSVLDVKTKKHYSDLGFENFSTPIRSVGSVKFFSVENNVVSFYITADGIQKNKLEKEGITINIENFGIIKGNGEFETVSALSESITIPPEQINKNDLIKSHSDIDGVPADMELSLLGINIIFDSKEDYCRIEDEISHRGIITPTELCIFMKDGTVYGGGENMGKAMDILGGGSGGIDSDGKYYRYIRFNMPADIEKIEKITLGGYEFSFGG